MAINGIYSRSVQKSFRLGKHKYKIVDSKGFTTYEREKRYFDYVRNLVKRGRSKFKGYILNSSTNRYRRVF